MITVTATADRTRIRAAGDSTRYLHLRLVAPPRAGATRAPVHVAFVIDRSGSMAGSRLDLARVATHEALGFLAPSDRFTVVTFDDHVQTVVAPTEASYAAVAAARERIRAIEPGGSTALCEGWLTGCAAIGEDDASVITRCLLLTDGHANVGETQPVVIAQHASELRKRHVTTSTFGLGDGFSEDLLHAMAAAGGGHFYFVEHAAQIRDFFTSELGEALEVVARDVTVSVAHPRVRIEPMVAYTVEPRPDGAAVRVGDLCASQVVEMIIKLRFGDGAVGDSVEVPIVVAAQGDAPLHASVRFTFADHAANDTQPRVLEVDRLVATTHAAEARRAAVLQNRAGDFVGAGRRLSATARRVASYAHGDPELMTMVTRLEADAARFGRPMDETSRKRSHHASTSSLKGRDETTGRARLSSE